MLYFIHAYETIYQGQHCAYDACVVRTDNIADAYNQGFKMAQNVANKYCSDIYWNSAIEYVNDRKEPMSHDKIKSCYQQIIEHNSHCDVYPLNKKYQDSTLMVDPEDFNNLLIDVKPYMFIKYYCTEVIK